MIHNKFLIKILELTIDNKIKWNISNSIIKYSYRLKGNSGSLNFILRINIRQTYICFGNKNNDFREIKADRKEIIELYREVNKIILEAS